MAFQVAKAKSKFQQQPQFAQFLLTYPGLRPHQREALKFVHDWKAACKETPLTATIVLPTGAGKSGIAACLPFVLGSDKCLIITPRAVITKQLHDDITGENPKKKAFFVKTGICTEQDFSNLAPPTCPIKFRRDIESKKAGNYELTITNAHKFDHEQAWQHVFPIELMDLIIVDEAHWFPSTFWSGIVEAAKRHRKQVVFLTATPFRSDGREVIESTVPPGWTCGRYYRLSLAEAQARKIIRTMKPTFLGPLKNRDDDLTYFRSLLQQMSSLLVSKEAQWPLPPDAEGKPQHHKGLILAYPSSNADRLAVLAAKEFDGIIVKEFHTRRRDPDVKNTLKSRRKRLKGFEEGNTQVLIVVDQLREGYDYPCISIVGVACLVSSPRKLYQFIGRGVRVLRPDNPAPCDVLLPDDLREMYECVVDEKLIPEQGADVDGDERASAESDADYQEGDENEEDQEEDQEAEEESEEDVGGAAE